MNDNCMLDPRPSQCDTDGDGYGNQCDGDFNQDGVVAANDRPIFDADLIWPSIDSGTGTDMDCNCCVNAVDYEEYWLPKFAEGVPGPSGLACAGFPPACDGFVPSCRTTAPCGPQ